MSGQVDKIIQQFNQLEVPLTQRFSTSPEESLEIAKLQDEYFDRVMTSLALSRRALVAFFSIEYRVLCAEQPGGARLTDDFDASFWLSGVQPLASIKNVRDASNFQIILFAKYPLSATAEDSMRTILAADLGS